MHDVRDRPALLQELPVNRGHRAFITGTIRDKDPGHALVGPWTVVLLYSLSVFTDIWGRLSLGRNIGMLPAQREIVERGAYGWVRHPIYTSVLIMVLIGLLTAYSVRNLVLYSLGVFWFVARTLAEEEFLQKVLLSDKLWENLISSE